MKLSDKYDYVIIGSGFGGSVSAFRLSQKGYSVLVVEKGDRYSPDDFSKGTTRPSRWIWKPRIGMRGIMQITTLRHVSVMSGVGVGGGSLVYAATLPKPKSDFFVSGSWCQLRDWENDLKPHYRTALKMLGAEKNPKLTSADLALQKLAKSVNREHTFAPTRVGIYFNSKEPGKSVADPYFEGNGPSRRGCIQCGDCMTGCQHNAKNSLDKNYLYLAEQLGVDVISGTEVTSVSPTGASDGSDGYFIAMKHKTGLNTVRAKGVIFAGGVMGTVPLLLKLKSKKLLPNLSDKVGHDVRTNNESLTAVTAIGKNPHFDEGVAIGSIFHPDDHSHVEPIRFGTKSGLWRFMVLPLAPGSTFLKRVGSLVKNIALDPLANAKAWFARDYAGRSVSLLFMQHLDSTISIRRNIFGGLSSQVQDGQIPPSANIPLANSLAKNTEKIVGGKAMRLATEVILGAPATAHVLGGAVMGATAEDGVIDDHNRVFNYHNMYVCDGSAISANPGVNPSLSITAITEHAMSLIPARGESK